MPTAYFPVVSLLYALTFCVAPGALLAFSPLCRLLPNELRIPAAIIFSPLAVALELAVCMAIGLTFDQFVWWVAPVNLLGLLPTVLRGVGRGGIGRILPALVVGGAVILPAFVALFSVPHLQDYGWHNMMQAAAIQSLQQLPKMPEEMDLAGLRLNYGWAGYAQLATMSVVTDLPPVRLYPVLNFLQFCCMFLFLAVRARDPASTGLWLAALGVAIALLSPGLIDLTTKMVVPSDRFAGVGRIEPMTAKYFNLDSMVFGLSSFAVLVYAVIGGLMAWRTGIVALILLASLACGITYPLLFPSCAVVVGLFVVALLAARRWRNIGLPEVDIGMVAALTVGFAAITAVVGSYILMLGASATPHPFQPAMRWVIRQHLTQLAYVFGPAIVFALAMLPRWIRAGAASRVVPLVMFGVLLLCFCMITMPVGVEYKFLFAGLLVIAPALAGELVRLTGTGLTRIATLTALSCVVLGAASWALFHWMVPPEAFLTQAAPLDLTTRLIHPQSGWDGGWMKAAREATPAGTVLLTGDTEQPVSVFTNRPLYVALDWSEHGRPDGGTAGRIGYSMQLHDVLVKVKGYPAAEVDKRIRILYDCLGAGTDPAALIADLGTLAALHRPVAVHFTGEAALARLLRDRSLGRVVFEAGSDKLWYIPTDDLAHFAAR
jgi:hypothetical protein